MPGPRSRGWHVSRPRAAYLQFQAWLSVAFHAFALFQIGKAFMSLQSARKETGLR
jgi:hypothetical protein